MDILFTILFYVGWVFVLGGLVFFVLSGLGILRMPDTFTRIHAGTKATTLGAALSLIGVGLIQPEWFLKLFLLAMFFLITNPISSSVLARGAYKSGSRMVNKSGVDMYKDVSSIQDREIEKNFVNDSKSDKSESPTVKDDDATEEGGLL